MTAAKGRDPRRIRKRLEEMNAGLSRTRDRLQLEVSQLNAKRRELSIDVVAQTVVLLDLLAVLEAVDQDAQWLRRKAAIYSHLREHADRRAKTAQGASLAPLRLWSRDRQVNLLVDRIQEQNQYAHVSGDFTDKTSIQNWLLERYSEFLVVRFDGERLILIEYGERSAGHIPVDQLTSTARQAIASRLSLAST